MRGWLAAINKQPAGTSQVEPYTNLVEVEQFFRGLALLPFDQLAAEQFHRLKSQKIRISTMDLKIAAIVLISRSDAPLGESPRLQAGSRTSVEDWLSKE